MDIKKRLNDHVNGGYLTSKEIQCIVKEFPFLEFSGPAYRGLTFKDEPAAIRINNDVCFSKTVQGAHSRTECDPDEEYVQLWCALVTGLDVSKALVHFDIENAFPVEDEIVAFKVQSSELMFSGSEWEYQKWFRRKF